MMWTLFPQFEAKAEPIILFYLDSVLMWLKDRAFMVLQEIAGSWVGFLKFNQDQFFGYVH